MNKLAKLFLKLSNSEPKAVSTGFENMSQSDFDAVLLKQLHLVLDVVKSESPEIEGFKVVKKSDIFYIHIYTSDDSKAEEIYKRVARAILWQQSAVFIDALKKRVVVKVHTHNATY